MRCWTQRSRRVSERRWVRGLDTCLIIDLSHIDPQQLPQELVISAITLAEPAAGPHATANPPERARRQDRLQRMEAVFDPLPTRCRPVADPLPMMPPWREPPGNCMLRWCRWGAKRGASRGGHRAGQQLPLCTSNPADFRDVTTLVDVRVVLPDRLDAARLSRNTPLGGWPTITP